MLTYKWENSALSRVGATPVTAGAGPRHIEFSSDGKKAYTSNELANTVSVFECSSDGTMKNIQEVSSVECKSFSNSSHIKLHPNGNFLYVANRFTNTIAVFAVDQTTGMLGGKNLFDCGGQTPRHFSFDPSGQWMLVANQDSSLLCTFQCSPSDGSLTFKKALGVPTLTAVAF